MIEDITKAEVLPDSRLLNARGEGLTPTSAHLGTFGWMVPIFCASCSKPNGEVPQENMTFVFWLCNDCFAKYGHLTNLMVMPDEVFWEKVKQEQLESHNRLLAESELIEIVSSDSSPLATLIKEGR